MRVLAAAALPVLACTVFFTFSRGAILVVPIGVVSAIPVVGGLIGVVVAIMYFAVPTDAFARAPSSAPAV